MNDITLFFGWPTGQVWPNLLASAITFTSGWMWAHRRLTHTIDGRLRDHHEWITQELQRLHPDMPHQPPGAVSATPTETPL